MTISVAKHMGDDEPAGEVAPASFGDVYERHAGSVHRFCLSQVHDPAVAEDLTHETFVRAFVAYERIRPDLTSTRAWLITIARNLCTEHHRRLGRVRRLVSRLVQGRPPLADVESVAGQRGEVARVTAALAAFPARDRQLIGLRVAADLSYREVAAVLGTSEAAAKVATHRALVKLRARLESSR
jgi:RNA polymerase sigma-70 factor (ECF subfamily)